jgi:NodT family efflux transporter outer membrane factor (OMF) lipoprotein
LPPAKKVPQAFAGRTDTTSIGDISPGAFFADEYLVNLVDTALRHNYDALIALQRIEAARATFEVSRATLLPSVDVVAAAGVDKYGKYTMNGVGNFDTNLSEHVDGDLRIPNPTPDYFLGLRSAWEIDLWGKLRSRKKALYARYLASRQGRHLVATSLVAEVATRYYQLLALVDELEIIRKNIALQEISLETIKIQKLGGRATQLAVQQFEAQLLRTRSLEAEKRQEIIATENGLNLLLGRYPQPIRRGVPLREQQLPREVAAGIPAQMLRRRPDVQRAALEMTAAKAEVDAAKAAFLPSLRITPYLGLNAFKASLLLNPGSVAYGALAGLAAPVLNRKALRSNYYRTSAGNTEAFYRYQRAVLSGYQEVVTGLSRIENLNKVYAFRTQEVAVLLDAVSTANTLFVAGYASYLEVVTAQRRVLEAELELIDTRQQQFLSLVDLYRSLGGGWQ